MIMRVLKAICCAAALTAMLAPAAHADEWNKKTILTFSGPVQIPGVTLPAGSYVFKLADLNGNRHVVQVFDKDEQHIYATILAIPNDRLDPADKPIILFSERAAGSPQAVKVWYYPGDRIGDEFVYPKSQAMRIAKQTHQSVLAYNDESGTVSGKAGEVPSGMRNAQVGYFDENGNWQTQDHTMAVNSSHAQSTTAKSATDTSDRAAAATTTASTSSDRTKTNTANTGSRMAQNTTATHDTRATGTSGARAPRKHLPRTASTLPLIELFSLIALGGGLTARTLRLRTAEAR